MGRGDAGSEASDARAETHRALLREAPTDDMRKASASIFAPERCARECVRARQSPETSEAKKRDDIDDDPMRAEKKTDSFA